MLYLLVKSLIKLKPKLFIHVHTLITL